MFKDKKCYYYGGSPTFRAASGEGGGRGEVTKKKNAFDELPKKGASTICRWVTKKQGGEFF